MLLYKYLYVKKIDFFYFIINFNNYDFYDKIQ